MTTTNPEKAASNDCPVVVPAARGGASLRVSAAMLAGLLGVQLLVSAQPVRVSSTRAQGMVSQAGGHTIMAADAGNENLLMIIDSRSEELLVYRTTTQGGMQLFQRLNLPQVFSDARSRAVGR
ncbi:MAG: hypothetical protein KF859_08185 [Phycisphaeraceae bacterium]|nr:hypothetical protein [Phycisphaeraceae bacterium]